MSKESVISVNSLKKSFSNAVVLKDVSFQVPKGAIFSLLGSNGAGKTTIIKILSTLLKPDSGNIEICGFDLVRNPESIHKKISLTGQFAAVDDSLTGLENLMLMCELHQVPNPREKTAQLLHYFELSNFSDKLVSTYSGGMKRKLDIAMSLVGNPSVIFLDEPTTALDPQSRHTMWRIIKELNQTGVTIFLTTQYLEEAEQLATQIAILNKGMIIAEGTSAELKQLLPQTMLEFVFPDAFYFEKACCVLSEFKVIPVREDYKITLYTNGKADLTASIFQLLISHEIKIENFSQSLPTLEDVFLTIIEQKEGKSHETVS